MHKILRAMFQPVPLALLGLLALALLIWWIGPLIAIAGQVPLESAAARATAIALLLLAFALRIGYQRFQTRAGEVNLLRRLFGRPKPEEPIAVQRLRQGLEQAVRLLRASQHRPAGKLSRLLGLDRQRALYQRPWYLLIGAPGSGKTTALAHCGLHFTRSDQPGIEQVRLARQAQDENATPGCDWWLGDEALLLDTAGRYTSQDSGQASEREGWLGLLALLRQQRPRQPLNGVILTLSAADLLDHSESAAMRQAPALRARLQELERQLGLRLPVYLLVTKADLIAGFEPFFAALDQAGRDQVWGCTLPLDGPEASDPAQSLAPRLDALRERLQDQLLARLQQEPELDRRGAITGFDQQFAACCRQLLAWVRAVFAVSEPQQAALLRGVYFSSAVQQGQPINPLLSRLGQACGLERRWLSSSAGSGRSYFLPRLLRELVFAEQQLAGLALTGEQRRERLQLGLLAVIAVLSVTLLAAWAVSYRDNSHYVAQVDQAIAAARPMLVQASRTADLATLLPLLETVANISATPTRASGEPGDGMGLGLFQGDKLDAAARQASGALLRELLLPRISQRIDQQLREQDGSDPEFSYEALKAYLMLHQPAHFDPAALKAWVLRDWEHQPDGGLNIAGRAALERQLDALFAAGPLSPPTTPDPALIARSRNRLLQEPLARRIYSRLRREGVGAGFTGFSVLHAVGPEAALVFARRSGKPLGEVLPGLYTRNGYRQGFGPELDRLSRQLAVEADWVLGAGAGLQQAQASAIAQQVRELYLADYARTWEALLADLTLRPSANLAQSVQLARLLSSPDSPLLKLVTAIVRETTLVPAPPAAADPTSDRLTQAKAQLGRLFGQDNLPAVIAHPDPAAQRLVDNRFAALRQLVAGEPPSAPIQTVLKRLDELYLQLSASETAIRDRLPPPAGDAGARLKAESARLPEPLRSLLPQLAAMGAGQTLSATRQRLSAELGQQIGEFCRLATEGRYPFLRSSPRDVTPEDFARLFAPGGLFDQFFQQQLAPHVDRSSRPWRFRPQQEQSFGSPGQLVQFERAAVIRDVFFGSGMLRFDFKLLEAGSGLTPMTEPATLALEVDGQRLAFDPEQPRRQSIQWPGPRSGLTAQLRLGSELIATEGPWALLRLLERARIEPLGAPEKFKASFEAGSQRASFEVSTASVRNPLRLRELAEFRCPQGL